MCLLAWALWVLRDRYRPGVIFGLYLVGAGLERFLVEFIRRNDAVLLGLTTPQLESVAMFVGGGIWLWVLAHRGGWSPRVATA
jgi:phosphatidylglycerol:prolipoprotein diacylglycerol transferase